MTSTVFLANLLLHDHDDGLLSITPAMHLFFLEGIPREQRHPVGTRVGFLRSPTMVSLISSGERYRPGTRI